MQNVLDLVERTDSTSQALKVGLGRLRQIEKVYIVQEKECHSMPRAVTVAATGRHGRVYK